MVEAEQGIKMTEAGITMKQYIPIIFGWALGIASTLFIYWFGRFIKRRDFKNGLKSELKGNLKRIVFSVADTKMKFGKLGHEHLNWMNNSLLKIHSQKEIDERHPWMKELLDKDPDVLEKESYDYKILKEGVGTELKKFNLVFLKNHLDKVLLLDINSQKLIYNIQYQIDGVNQAVDRYLFYFDKTFEPKILDVNENQLKGNMDAANEMISKSLYIVANDFIALIEKL